MVNTAFMLVAAILALVVLARSRAADLTAWAVLSLAIALLYGRIHL